MNVNLGAEELLPKSQIHKLETYTGTKESQSLIVFLKVTYYSKLFLFNFFVHSFINVGIILFK